MWQARSRCSRCWQALWGSTDVTANGICSVAAEAHAGLRVSLRSVGRDVYVRFAVCCAMFWQLTLGIQGQTISHIKLPRWMQRLARQGKLRTKSFLAAACVCSRIRRACVLCRQLYLPTFISCMCSLLCRTGGDCSSWCRQFRQVTAKSAFPQLLLGKTLVQCEAVWGRNRHSPSGLQNREPHPILYNLISCPP